MTGYYTLILALCIAVSLSTAQKTSSLLSHYDFKVTNSEATCRLANHPNLPENRRTLEGRDCMCDAECGEYKDCCKDSRYYNPSDQSQPLSYHCSDTTAVYLMAKCAENWKDKQMAEKCERSIKPVENEDFAMVLPIANQRTRKVYGNQYCAICNNDLDMDSWVPFPLGVACGEAPPGYLKYKPNIPSYTPPPPPQPPPSVDSSGLNRDRFDSLFQNVFNQNQPEQPQNQNPYQPSVSEYPSQYQPPSFQYPNAYQPVPQYQAQQYAQAPPNFILDIHLFLSNGSEYERFGNNVFRWPVQVEVSNPEYSDGFSNRIERRKRQNKGEIDFSKYSSQSMKIFSTAKWDKYNQEFISNYNNKIFVCKANVRLPENASNFTRNCVPQLERGCPADFKDETIKEECAIHTKVVYNKKTKKPYRNKDCARCNKEKESDVDGTPQQTRLDLSGPSADNKSGGVSGGVGGGFQAG